MPKIVCYECCGTMGWYTSVEGHQYASDPDDEMTGTYRTCPRCLGTGYEPEALVFDEVDFMDLSLD